MRFRIFFPLIIFFCAVLGTGYAQNNDGVSISGRVTDFDGNPIDSCLIAVLYPDFSIAFSACSDNEGRYLIPNVPKGRYMGIYAVRQDDYPHRLKVAEEDMRLEFWAWNVIADQDLTINPRYHRLELYGTTVFRQNGGYPGMIIYTRPMSLGRLISHGYETSDVDLSVEHDEIEFKVYADEVPVAIQSVQPVMEYSGGRRQIAYLIYADLPAMKPNGYSIIRIEALNRAYGGEKGENIYFYESPEYEKACLFTN